ncbi:MAG: TonB-dependent receptor [Alphaproteobacteria bacterium]|nr:TonB-dependent receptor [Alphaproteobacteria bacterium]
MSLLALLATAFAGGRVEGHVFADTSGAPLANVTVRVGDSEAVTDASGHFALPAEAGELELVVSAEGRQGGSVAARVSDGGVTEVLVTLSATEAPGFLLEQPEVATVQADDDAVVALTGIVRDAGGRPLPDIRVFVRGVEGLARTDADGRFTLSVPEGTHTLAAVGTGYTSAELEVATGGEVVVTLAEAPRALSAFTISAPYLEGSVAGLLDDRKEGGTVADVLGADEMSRAGDSDAASALARVTGLTVVDGKYVFVRGLGDRYSSSLLNGGMLPSPEPERRVVPLDLFPTSILKGVVVQKTWTPDMPGEFGGGVVQLQTIDPPTEWVSSIQLSGTYRQGTTFTKGLVAPGGPTDFFGFDGGFRALPEEVAIASAESPLEEGDLFSDRGYTAAELEKLGEAMDSHYSPLRKALPPGLGLSASLGNGVERDGVSAGFLGAFTFGNDWKQRDFQRTYYTPDGDGGLRPQHRYAFDEAVNEVSFGGFLTGGLKVGTSELTYTGMLSRSSDDTARIYEGYNDDVGADIRVTRTRWVERQLFWNQVRGKHGLGKLQLDWHAIYAGANRLEPDRKETRFDNEPGTDRWLLSDRPEGNGRFFSDAGEKSGEGALDLTWRPFRTEERDGIALKTGARVTIRERSVDTRRFKYFHKGAASRDPDVLTGTPEDIFTPDNIGPDGFQFEEFTRQTDNYSASHRILAAYAMADVPIRPWLSVLGGVRLEHSAQDVETFELFNPSQTPVKAELTTLDVLPAATVTLAPTDSVRIRAGGARTVSRPDFRELSPATFNDVTGGRQTFGNPELQRALIDHADVRFEWFLASGEVVSVGAFAKRFTRPVETVVVPSAQQSVTWENAEGATNTGVELELRKSLPLNLWAAGNLALIRSRIQLAEGSGIQTSSERALQGQSPWVLNLQAGWEHPERADRVTVVLNAVGRRITEVGALGAPDVYELPVPELQVVGRKELGAGFAATAKLGNVLNPAAVTMQGENEVDRIKSGWTLGLGLRWSP